DHLSNASLSPNTWTHIAVAYNNPDSKIYINGVLDSTKASTGGALNSGLTDAFMIGKYVSGNIYFNGKIDDVRIYNQALTDA
ncbi:LamG domain-containing protein, partial [Lacticaseibacillus paracasei]